MSKVRTKSNVQCLCLVADSLWSSLRVTNPMAQTDIGHWTCDIVLSEDIGLWTYSGSSIAALSHPNRQENPQWPPGKRSRKT
jgi:hypothetical protein